VQGYVSRFLSLFAANLRSDASEYLFLGSASRKIAIFSCQRPIGLFDCSRSRNFNLRTISTSLKSLSKAQVPGYAVCLGPFEGELPIIAGFVPLSISKAVNSHRTPNGGEGVRTPDLRLAKPALFQTELHPQKVGLSRFELLTSRLSGVRSNQLSYRPK
jgi:hypothetical protein